MRGGLIVAFSLLLAAASLGDASLQRVSALEYMQQLAASTCSQAGQVICSQECDQVILCVSNGDGFSSVTLETCSEGSTRCSAEEGACVSGGSSCGANTAGGIACTEQGIFPDPLDCNVYHLCLDANVVSFPLQCEPGYAFNALTSDCSYLTTDPVCTEGPVPPCESVGQTGALATNPSIYYVCVKDTTDASILIPQLYKCHGGQIYDNNTYSCVDPTSTTPSADSSSSSTTTTTTTPGPETPRPPVTGAPCSPPMVIVRDPADCTRYYECGSDYTWWHVACTWGFYFNPVHNRCELGFC